MQFLLGPIVTLTEIDHGCSHPFRHLGGKQIPGQNPAGLHKGVSNHDAVSLLVVLLVAKPIAVIFQFVINLGRRRGVVIQIQISPGHLSTLLIVRATDVDELIIQNISGILPGRHPQPKQATEVQPAEGHYEFNQTNGKYDGPVGSNESHRLLPPAPGGEHQIRRPAGEVGDPRV